MIEDNKVVTIQYELYVSDANDGNGQEELFECATAEHPLIYCHGQGMMLPAFEAQMTGLQKGDHFDFRIAYTDAYGEYDADGVRTLDKTLFYNGDGEFDSERVYVGNIVPMNTVDGEIVKAQVVEVNDTNVVIDLNHPLAGENMHFVGTVLDLRDVTAGELKALHHKGCCRGCENGCNDCHNGCEGCKE